MKRLTITLAFAAAVLFRTALTPAQPPGPGGPGTWDTLSLVLLPDHQQQLKLSAEQERQLFEIAGQVEEQRFQLFESMRNGGGDDPESRFAQIRHENERISAKADEQVRSILTEDQRRQLAQLQRDAGDPPDGPREFGRRGGFGPPGMGGPGGMGGPPGMGQERKLIPEFDKDGDGRLNDQERAAARKSLASDIRGGGRRGPMGGRGPGGGGPGMGGPGRGPGGGERNEPGKPGIKVSKSEVTPLDAPLYEPLVIRTIFLDFENENWEAELEAFNNTDVDVPATLTVDGQIYPDVGVHFRGMSSYFMVPTGSKRSLNVSIDYANDKQRLQGYKTLNLNNAHEDPTFLHSVLYFQIARNSIPTPKANLVRVVINGENWGLYNNVQQFDKVFIAENYPGKKGTRWKVPGSPNGRGGLEYLGDDVDAYRRIYEMKSDGENSEAWQALIRLCRTLHETPIDQLQSALEPMLDLDGVLWFLALENALINSDGYWVRASDYSLFLDDKGKFHVIPHDANETFQAGRGPGMGGGPPGMGMRGGRGEGPMGPPGGREGPAAGREGPPGGQNRMAEGNRGRRGFGGPPGGPGGGAGINLDPLVGMDDESKPLRSRLLKVPALREQYLKNVREIAERWLDWKQLGPIVADYTKIMRPEIQTDTRKLTSLEAFDAAVGQSPAAANERTSSLKSFADQRRSSLLNHPEIKQLKR